MSLADVIAQSSILHALKASSKKQVLQELAECAAQETGLPEREIFDVILQRERLGSTGVGNGIAIPHGKLQKLDTIVGFCAKLEPHRGGERGPTNSKTPELPDDKTCLSTHIGWSSAGGYPFGRRPSGAEPGLSRPLSTTNRPER